MSGIFLLASMSAVALGVAHRADTVGVPVVVECRIGDVASVVLEARTRDDGVVLLPVRRVLALAGLDSTIADGERSIAGMEALLHAAAVFDTTSMVIQFADSGTLPVSRRFARSRDRARLAEERAALAQRSRPASVSLIPAAVTLAYEAQRDAAMSVSAALRVAGGVAELTAARAADGLVRRGMVWTSLPSRSLGDVRLRIGAIDELAGASGVELTNAPIGRVDTLDIRRLDAPLPTGTEVELFEDGMLVGADSLQRDGRFRLDVAELRGVHELRMIAYDSVGRTRVTRWIDFVPEALLRWGELRYAVATCAGARSSCARPVGSIAYAPLDGMTIAAHFAHADAATRGAPGTSTTLVARLGQSAAVSVAARSGGAVSGELRVERGRNETIVLRAARKDPQRSSFIASSLLPTTITGTTVTGSGSWRVGETGAVNVLAGAVGPNAIVAATGGATSAQGAVRGEVALVEGAVRCAGAAGAVLLWGAWLPRMLAALRSTAIGVRAERRASPCGDPWTGSLSLRLPSLRGSAIELSAAWQQASDARRRIAFSVTFRRRIGDVMDARAELVDGESTRIIRSGVSGALIVDALHRTLLPRSSAAGATSGVLGVVYVDENGNGRRDSGEGVVEGALLRIGEATAVSDERGAFLVPALATDRVVRVSVDSLSVEDGGFVPDVPIVVSLVARALVSVDVPVRRARRASPTP